MRSLLLLLLLFVSSVVSIPSLGLGLEDFETLDSTLWDFPSDESGNAILPDQLDISFMKEDVYEPSSFSTDLWPLASEDDLAFKLDDSALSLEYPTVPDKPPFGLPFSLVPSNSIRPCKYVHTFCSSLSPSDTYTRQGETTKTLRNAKRYIDEDKTPSFTCAAPRVLYCCVFMFTIEYSTNPNPDRIDLSGDATDCSPASEPQKPPERANFLDDDPQQEARLDTDTASQIASGPAPEWFSPNYDMFSSR